MIYFLPILFGSILILSLFSWFYLKYSYKQFCQKEDIKDRINILKKKIISAKTYLRHNYNTPETYHVIKDIVPKIEFLVKLIEKTDFNHQEEKFQILLNLTTETLYRLQTDFYNIQAIVSPLNTLRDQLVHEYLDYIKQCLSEEDILSI
jgi:chromosome segregation ATPase